eukprot:GGOE01037170.1.p1 GENE.GGOE01037170.1~~GGOE01037170.1.p1  ORF type:complete len:244 (+),score=53.71 GGOE01037170.1:43-732(+)
MSEASQECAACSVHLDLVQRSLPCRCKRLFCDAHRPSHRHGCPVDYKELGRTEVLHTLAGGTAKQRRELHSGDPGQFSLAHALHHPPSPHTLALSHTLALLVLLCYLLLAVWACRPALALKGYLVSYAVGRIGHLLTAGWLGPGPLCGLGKHSTYCLWSSSGIWHPVTCAAMEYETLLSNLRYVLSAGKSNCMTRDLYCSKGLGDIAQVVKAKTIQLYETGFRRPVYVG